MLGRLANAKHLSPTEGGRRVPVWRAPECRAAERAGRRARYGWTGGDRRAFITDVGPGGSRRCFVWDEYGGAGGGGSADALDVGFGGLAVYRPGRADPVQELTIGDPTVAGPPVVMIDDLEFDGYLDLGLQSMGNMHNPSYAFYVYVPRTGQFVHWRDDNDLTPDPKRRVLTQHQHVSAGEGSDYTFRVPGHGPKARLVLVEAHEYKPDKSLTHIVHTVERVVRGRWRVVRRWREPL